MLIKLENLLLITLIFLCFSITLEKIFVTDKITLIAAPLSILFAVITLFKWPSNILKRHCIIYSLAFLIYSLLLTMLNDFSVIAAISSLKDFLPFVMFLVGLLVINMPKIVAERLVSYIYIFCWLQVPVCIYQVFIAGIELGDSVGGTFGSGSNQLVLLTMVFFNIISASYYLSDKIKITRYAIDLSASLIPVILASTIFSFIMLVIHILLVVLLSHKKRAKQINTLILGVGVLIIIAAAAIVHDQYRERGRVTSYFEENGLEKVFSYGEGLTKEGTYGRITSIQVSFADICEYNFCQGYGFGASNVGSSLDSMGIAEIKHRFRKVGRTQVSFILIETGILGILYYLIVTTSLYMSTMLKSELDDDATHYITKLMILSLPLISIYQKPLNYAFSGFIIALFLSFAININNDKKRVEDESKLV